MSRAFRWSAAVKVCTGNADNGGTFELQGTFESQEISNGGLHGKSNQDIPTIS